MAANDFGASIGQGATIRNLYVERDVNIVAVLENELDTLAFFNSLTTAFLSIGSFIIALACGIWTNAAFVADKTLPPNGYVLSWYVAPGLVVLGICFYLGALWARSLRQSTWRRICGESKTDPTTPPAPQ